jgi:GMP synthase (glutamine-hydrolysing)
MKIGILVTGTPSACLGDKYGGYDDQFRCLLDGHGFDFESYLVVANRLPAADDECDGYLITGSAHDVGDDLPWMDPLTRWLQQTFGRKPIVGICFGHQMVAHALGGRVEKASTGWIGGIQDYELVGGGSYSASSWHNDQVVELPAVAVRVTATGRNCSYAGLAYEDGAISYQCHPEFDDAYMGELYDCHFDLLAQSSRQEYLERLGSLKVEHQIDREIADFFRAGISRP